MFGSDFLKYSYSKDHGTSVDDDVSSSLREYNHDYWELQYCKHVLNCEESELSIPDDAIDNFCHPGENLNTGLQLYAPAKLASHPIFQQTQCKDLSDSSANLNNDVQNDSPKNIVLSHPTSSKQSQPTAKIEKHDDFVSAKSHINTQSSNNCSTCEKESDLRVAMAKAKTRAEEAALFSLVPPVSRRPSTGLHPVYDAISTSDPFTLSERPCESVVQKAQKVLDDERKNGRHPWGVNIIGMGQFSEADLSNLKKFCSLASTN